MQRIADTNAVTARPSMPVLTGLPVGFFTNGNPGVQAPTVVPDWWLNMAQEELCALLAAAGLPLDGTASVLQAVSIIGARQQIFTGTGAWTCPAGVYRAKLRIWGGGGPGGNGNTGAGGGGAAGGYFEGYAAVVPGTVYPVTIGAGGVPGVSSGGASSFSSIASATGGGGGGLGPNGPGSTAFGTGAGTGLASLGQSGQNGLSTSAQNTGGQGGGAPYYFGGAAQPVGAGGNANGNNGQIGCGGSGGVGSGSGGAGGIGIVIVEY